MTKLDGIILALANKDFLGAILGPYGASVERLIAEGWLVTPADREALEEVRRRSEDTEIERGIAVL